MAYGQNAPSCDPLSTVPYFFFFWSHLFMYRLHIHLYTDLFSYNYVIILIHYVTCWVPSVTRLAFSDGIHISIYLL